MSGAVSTYRGSGASSGYAGPIGFVGGRPDGETNSEYIANNSTGGGLNLLLGNPIGKRMAQRAADAQVAQEKQAIEQEQATRNANVAKIRALFGMGDSADAGQNAHRLSDYLDRYYRSFLDNQLSQVDRNYGDATRQSRQNLARVGQLGSGLETSSRASTLSDYLRQRQQAVTNAAQARSALDSSLAGQRMSLEQQVSAGTVANPDYASYLRNQEAMINQAQAQIPANQVGQAFDVAGEAYRTGRIQAAQGNQGLAAFSPSGSSGGGRIS